MAEVLDWQRVDDIPAFAHFAAQALRRGYLMAFPTEAGYVAVACALRDEAMTRLLDVGDRPLEIVASADGVRDWLPELGAVGRKLVKRFWPGPLTVVGPPAGGLSQRFAPGIRERVQKGGVVHARHPGHESLREAAAHLAGPLVLRPIAQGQNEAFTARQALEAVNGLCNLLIDDGTSRFRQPPTVVEVNGDEWRISREGVLSEELIRQQMATLIVFVCTGNTCRSPLAEGICKLVLAEKLGCAVGELATRGYRVVSAGMAAASGMPAADEAVEVAKALGADLSSHASQPLTMDLLEQADHVFVMTSGHLRAILEQVGAENARLLCPKGGEVADPIGQSREVYEQCARQMREYIEARVAELL